MKCEIKEEVITVKEEWNDTKILEPEAQLNSTYSLNEILTLLEEGGIHVQADKEIEVYIQPPNNANENLTDDDSGDEDAVTLSNLPGSQLLAPAELPQLFENNDVNIEEVICITNKCTDQPPKKVRKEGNKKTYKWCKRPLDINMTNWPEKQNVHNELSPMELFFLFFDEDVISLILDKTNLYAALRNRVGDVTTNELYCFIGILLLSGYVTVPRRRMYWETALDTRNELVLSSISRDRFEFIMTNIHVCENDKLNKEDRFAKVRPLYDALNDKFLQYAPHEENHVIDESMVPYYGRHGLKQFIRGKPIRYGYKIWVGATSKGYTIWKDPCQGKSTTVNPTYKDFGLGAAIVLQYCDILTSAGIFPYHLYFNNFFGGLPLLEELKNRNIKASCTMRENRIATCPLKDSTVMKKTDRGTFDYKTDRERNIIVMKWNDNNIVTAASNAIGIYPLHQVTRFSQKEKKHIKIPQPHLIHECNKHMGGVDRSDQNISLYRVAIRGKKWYFPLIFDCIESAEQNAWHLHCINGGKLDHLTFRRRLVCNLLETYGKGYSSRSGRSQKKLKKDSRYDHLDHFVAPQEKQIRCRQCHMKCTTRCMKCDVGLHTKCFIAFHTKS
ncbi:piggyBac transposable element-derived protein 3-like isoform X2 [Periplaneta americana]